MLPAIVHIGRHACAAVIDVDDKDEKDFSVFDMKDLWQALSDVVGICWLGEKHNGRGYPGSQTAWTGFVRGVGSGTAVSLMETMMLGNRTVTILDLSKGRNESGDSRMDIGTAKIDVV